MKITFHGGAQSVTGSNYLVETGGIKFLIDWGIFEGSVEAEARNYEPFPYDVSEIKAVFVTHSHADHTGRLPKLYKDGFRGTLYATPPALDMIRVALPDNLNLMTVAAQRVGRPALFTGEDLEGIINLGEGVDYGRETKLADDVTVVLHDAGHILGSSIIEILTEGKKVYFSGDLGNPPTPLLKNFEYPLAADYIVVESAYGDRVHEDRSRRLEKLRQTIKNTITRGGTLMIPSFAMERTQELLFELNGMVNAKEIPRVPMFIDSPLAIKMTEVYQKYPEYFNTEAMQLIKSGDDLFNFPGLQYMRTSEESKHINDVPEPKIIIAGSGMSNGGRIQHHERRYLSEPQSTILFIGFQVEGTLGRRILDGAPAVKIFDEMVPVRCHIEAIGGYSAHADQAAVVNWTSRIAGLKKVFVVQGEEGPAGTLASKIRDEMGFDAEVPRVGQAQEL